MPNPWLQLPDSPPYVLPIDAALVHEHDAGAPDARRHKLQLLPEPYLGDPRAPVVLLSRNPGYDPDDDVVHVEPTFVLAARENLAHALAANPFYLLSPVLAHAPGARYWRRKLGPVAREVQMMRGGDSDDAWRSVATHVACIEYFPYHSSTYCWRGGRLPSFDYSLQLLRSAVVRSAVVVALRAVNDWIAALPELATHALFYTLNSSQNVTLSARNCPRGFDRIVAAVAAPGAVRGRVD